jgi:hypothetical protein
MYVLMACSPLRCQSLFECNTEAFSRAKHLNAYNQVVKTSVYKVFIFCTL